MGLCPALISAMSLRRPMLVASSDTPEIKRERLARSNTSTQYEPQKIVKPQSRIGTTLWAALCRASRAAGPPGASFAKHELPTATSLCLSAMFLPRGVREGVTATRNHGAWTRREKRKGHWKLAMPRLVRG